MHGRALLKGLENKMIRFINNNNSEPFKILREKYKQAYAKNEESIEALCISSYSPDKKMVDSRYVNLKIVDDNKFIFLQTIIHQNQNNFFYMIRFQQSYFGKK